MSGLLTRRVLPLALMKSANRVPIRRASFEALTAPRGVPAAVPFDHLRIPGSSGQGFRFDPVTHSNLIRSPIPGHPVTLSG